MLNKRLLTVVGSSLALLLPPALPGCGYSRKNESYSTEAAVEPKFASIASRIIVPKCLPCHSHDGGAPDLASYSAVARRVRAGNPERSEFYTSVESGSMPVDRPMLSDDELLAIFQWIRNGAAND
jgi:hypothetical protein